MNAVTPALPPTAPAVDSRELVYRNPYQEIHRVCLRFGDHAKTIFVNEHGQRVGVLLLREGAVLLVRQYRLLVTGLAWEIPGGRVDGGETPEIAARREAIEEAGVRCGHLHSLLYFLPGLDTCNNPTHLFYCDDFEESRSAGPDSLEVVDQNWKPLEECLEMIFSGEIVDGLTIIALLAHHTRLRRP